MKGFLVIKKIPKIIEKLVLPFFAVFLATKFNFVYLFNFIPEGYSFSFSVSIYLVLLCLLWGFLIEQINSRKVKIECIFYGANSEKNIENTPTIVCNDDTNGVGYLNYYITLEGNPNILKKLKLEMTLPSWLSTQVSSDDTVLECYGEKILWTFDKLLSENSNENHPSNCKGKISLIRTSPNDNLTVYLSPKVSKNNPLINLQKNEAKIQSRG